MRTFIAIELPREIKDFLSDLQDQLKASRSDFKWVEPQNIHLTLKFLGEINDEQLNKIIKILDDAAKSSKDFRIRIASVGAFPKINFPRVIWVGIDQGNRETKELAKTLEEKIEKIGIAKEDRPFSSHITIGRLRSPLNREGLVKELNNLVNNFGQRTLEFHVTKITLFKSTLTPKGPIYEILYNANLKTA